MVTVIDPGVVDDTVSVVDPVITISSVFAGKTLGVARRDEGVAP